MISPRWIVQERIRQPCTVLRTARCCWARRATASCLPCGSGLCCRGGKPKPYHTSTKLMLIFGRMIKWVAGVSTQTQFTIEHTIRGIAIICDTTSLQRKLLDTYTNMTKESDSKFQLLASYSYWTLISISQH